MNLEEIFAKRLKNARIMQGKSMEELAKAMQNNYSKMAISKYEKGQLAPNSEALIAFAEALNLPVDYFFRPFTVQIDSIKFRKLKSKLGSKLENSIKENINDMIERYMDIEEICNATTLFEKPFADKISSPEQVKEAARVLREQWQIGNAGIVKVIDLLEEHGIKVLEIKAEPSFGGLSSKVNNQYPIIVLNKTFAAERKRFTALHELGHIILPFDDSVSEKDEEALCHLFASEMLILETVFKNILGPKRHDISYQELRAIQEQYGISCDALMYKAKECGIISQKRYKTYCIQKNKYQVFKDRVETNLYQNESSSRFSRLVYKALSNDLITTSKAAALLHQSVAQVREDLALV